MGKITCLGYDKKMFMTKFAVEHKSFGKLELLAEKHSPEDMLEEFENFLEDFDIGNIDKVKMLEYFRSVADSIRRKLGSEKGLSADF